jgi:hypothetical protein
MGKGSVTFRFFRLFQIIRSVRFSLVPELRRHFFEREYLLFGPYSKAASPVGVKLPEEVSELQRD